MINNPITIEAKTQCAQSTLFELRDSEGRLVHRQLENFTPFALFGDDPRGDYQPWEAKNGTYSLTITPFTESLGQGNPGNVVSLQFTIVGGESSRELLLMAYPNPVNDILNIKVPENVSENVIFIIRDFKGKQMYKSTLLPFRQEYLIDINKLGIPSGRYFIELISEDKTLVQRQVFEY